MGTIDYRDFDRDIWERELEDFVPSVVYDMHTHMWSEAHKGTLTGPPTGLRWEIDYQDHLAWAAKLYPGREMHYLVFGHPDAGHGCRGSQRLAGGGDGGGSAIGSEHDGHAGDDAGLCRSTDQKHDFFGLKPYRTFASDPANGRIQDFLPESFIEVAHDMGLAITMHLSKKTGPADPENIKDLQYYTKQYPGAQWILAHCASCLQCVYDGGGDSYPQRDAEYLVRHISGERHLLSLLADET